MLVANGLGRVGHSLGEDESGPGALGVVFSHEGIGHPGDARAGAGEQRAVSDVRSERHYSIISWMATSPLIQASAIDVTYWELDEENARFPQGARTKDARYAPDLVTDSVITPGKRYLFKQSKSAGTEELRQKGMFAEQFWGEIIAYRVGCLLGLTVPPAFAAYDSARECSGALIEWFYEDGKEAFVLAGDWLAALRPGFERKHGNDHNLQDNVRLLRVLAKKGFLKEDWKQWWIDALLFDTLIGNVDRHQDNWGFLTTLPEPSRSYRFCPLFDNGTSLGYELLPEKFTRWNQMRLDQYIAKGVHHLRRFPNPSIPRTPHIDLLAMTLAEWPETKQNCYARIANLQPENFQAVLADLSHLGLPVPLSSERLDFVLRLLERRLQKLKALFS